MDLRIIGGVPLSGEVCIGGCKNAALPLLFSSLLIEGESEFLHVPDISDVSVALALLSQFGAVIHRAGERVRIDASHVSYRDPDPALIGKIRASTYLIGACLARFGRARIGAFGGCAFSPRPIDLHLSAAECFGASRDGDMLYCERVRGGRFTPPLRSVGATVNALFLAVSADSPSVISPYAEEPHVKNVISFLRSAGAVITERDGALAVTPMPLRPARACVIPDAIEAGTYLFAAMITGGSVRLLGADGEHLGAVLDFCRACGASVDVREGVLSLRMGEGARTQIIAAPYPAFPTDLQPPAAAVMSRYGGSVSDTVFPDRFGYLSRMGRFGAVYARREGGAVFLPSDLHGACVSAPDLRGGAALLLCALGARGQSMISNAEMLARGYDRLVGKLSALGALID